MDSLQKPSGRNLPLNALIILGGLFLAYAFLGNYIALPGYLRFLARGRTSAAGAALDASVVIGAVKTIIWMFAFQLGAFFIFLGTLQKAGAKRKTMAMSAAAGACWLGISGIPKIPGPYTAYFAVSGFIVLALIGTVLLLICRRGVSKGLCGSSLFRLSGYLFFALASWDVCGLGTTGRILHLDMAVKAGTQGLLVTQTSKLMLEFILAWGFTAASLMIRKDKVDAADAKAA